MVSGGRHHGIPEADVDLQGNAGSGEPPDQLDADAVVLVGASDLFSADGSRVELEPVLGRHLADLPQDRLHARYLGVARAEQIEVPCRPVGFPAPEREEHGALQDEGVRVGRLGEAVEEPLDAVPREHELEVLPALLRAVEEPLAHRGREIPRLAGAHAWASRYGRITFATRQIRANFQSSSSPPGCARR